MVKCSKCCRAEIIYFRLRLWLPLGPLFRLRLQLQLQLYVAILIEVEISFSLS